MAKLRNKTTDTLETRVAGRRYVTEPDGLLEVPDDVFDAHAWPGTVWDEVETPKSGSDHPRKTAAHKEN